ncbi:recombinase family protein [Streptomyces niveus]|uniref:recombinase family protein n=1 Tax=Streptomyces niveus TaxID=193462 RepID=UPI0035D68A1B
MENKTLARRRKALRVAIYLRVSTLKQLDGYGLDVQDERCRAWVEYQLKHTPHTIVDVYCDGGVSGKLAHRENLDRMTSDIQAGLIDVVVFAKLDRIGRTMRNIHRWVYDVTDYGVRVATADGRIDSDDQMFGIQLSLLAYMAEVEHALILERTMGGRIKKIAGGGWASGTPPYGYMLDDEGEPTVNPAELEQIAKFAELAIDQKATRGEAAKGLNQLGYRTRTGKLWEGNNLILRMRLAIRGYVDFTFSGTNEDGEEITTSYRLELPQLMSEDRRKALEAVLEDMKGGPRTSYSNHLLSGHLISLCGHARFGTARAKQNDVVYRCSNSAAIKEGHDCRGIPGKEVEEVVWGEVAKLLTDPDAIKGLVDEWLGSVPERAESYRTRLGEIDGMLHKLRNTRRKKIAMLVASLDEDDESDQELINELKDEIATKEKKLREEQERITEWLEDAEHKEERADSMRALVDRVGSNVNGLGVPDKKRILELLRVRVEIVGESKSRRAGGSQDPMLEWHRENGIAIPLAVSDEQWGRVEGILAGGKRKPQAEDRACFEMLLEKLRHDLGWHDYNRDERIGGKGWAFFYRAARGWFTSGKYAKALQAFGPYEGAEAPIGYTLPPMKIYGVIDDSPEDVVKSQARERTPSTKGITAAGAEQRAA